MGKKVSNTKNKAEIFSKKEILAKLKVLQPYFALASVGDYSKDIKIPKVKDEFTELYVGVQMLIEAIREKSELINELNESIEKKVKLKEQENSNELFFGVKGRLIKINAKDILFIKSISDYMLIQTSKEKYIVHSTLKSVTKKLNDKNFIRAHHSYIINGRKITEKHKDSVFIGKIEIPVSRANKKKVSTFLNGLK